MAVALSPEDQKRLIVSPATDTGRPARIAATRAMLWPCEPCGWPQPRITSSTSFLSSCGTLPSASLMQWAARSDGSVMLNEPRADLASGVRLLATTTASLMAGSFVPAGAAGPQCTASRGARAGAPAAAGDRGVRGPGWGRRRAGPGG